MKDNRSILYQATKFSVAILLLAYVYSCANMGMPEGGPKDEDPPKVVLCDPPNFSTFFDKQSIEITFDEYVVLKNVNQKLIISPPLPVKPEIKLKGKKILIELNNELNDSTTYTLNFGDAIVDNNEGNVLQNFQFVFSTGQKLDSLSVSGQILNAFTNQPEPDILVMAYSDLSDTVPQTVIPEYVSRTISDGSFSINNMRKSTYKIFALKDANSNYLFDMPNEAIAFLDTFVAPFAELHEKVDTIPLDTLGNDSIVRKTITKNHPSNISLHLFEEEFYKQYLKSTDRKNNTKIKLAFNQPVKDSIGINFLVPDTLHVIQEYHENRDSLFIWLTDSTEYNLDTIFLEASFVRKDSLGLDYLHRDSLKLGFRKKEKKKKEKEKEKEKVKGLQFSTKPTKNSYLEKNKNFIITFAEPVKKLDTSLIQLFTSKDTSKVRVPCSIKNDTNEVRNYHLYTRWEPDNRYVLIAEDSAITSYWNKYNDSTAIVFKTRANEDYGNIIINFDSINTYGIIQLLDEKEVILEEKRINKAGKTMFNFLLPGNFKMKFIFDLNNNGKWDTGNYSSKMQPEKVNFYPGEIKVRANWDLEFDWNPNISSSISGNVKDSDEKPAPGR